MDFTCAGALESAPTWTWCDWLLVRSSGPGSRPSADMTMARAFPHARQAPTRAANAIEVVDKIGENYTAEDTLTELVDPHADLERASLAVFDGDAMVG
ncbi:hypothetical protein JNUCC0626_36475 [Lentzea sp. JNUCC 0626]|uniref:hypothetical protein n=1 Tax=Lentzea sp. JNUCC 0626 TaxID=3367513 RepID=UPI0037499DD2